MTLTARATKSIRIRDVAGQRSGAIGFTKLYFAHEATGTEGSVLNLASLAAPSGWGARGFVQPSVNQLQSADMKAYRKNLELKSSVRGPLDDYDDYVVSSSMVITFQGFVLQAGEIITGKISMAPQPGLIAVDNVARPKTFTLLAGQTTIPVGWPFEVNKFPTEKLGAVMVVMDGFVQERCEGNTVSGAGNYVENLAATGLGNTITMKDAPFAEDRRILVVPLMAAAVAPSDSLIAYLDSLNGAMQIMKEDLALVTGNDLSRYNVAPSGVDLGAFGAKVVQMSNWLLKSADYTMLDGDRVMADTSVAWFTLTLPATGNVIIADAKKTWGTRSVLIASALIEGVNQTLTLDQDGGEVELRYVDGTYGWAVFKHSPEGV